ncbi:MAG: outer membrane protein transport protein [Deltaproteobacteria bacterium]|nr:outer membrane protein transport protein [Deltaproteobacteria bacterium]
MRPARRRVGGSGSLLGVVVVLAVAGAVTPARAGGLYLPTHGVRPLGRAGTFTAGGDDPGGLWYNPATLDLVGNQGLLEGALVAGSQSYARVDSGGNALGQIASGAPPQGIPTAAAAFRLGRGFTLGVGMSAPYASLPRYRAAGPQRYSLIDLDGTFMARIEAAVAYRVIDGGPHGTRVSIGASLQDMLLNFESRTVLNGCPGTVLSAPEDPQCDARVRMRLAANANFSGNLGVHVSQRIWRAAAAVQLPTWVSGQGTIQAGIPTHPLFRHEDGTVKASQVGDQARMSMRLPWILRAAFEMRPTPTVRAELELDYEGWSMHDAIRVVPKNVMLTNLNGGVPEYDIGPMTVWRGLTDTVSVRLGGEWDCHKWLTVRAGFGFESGAAPARFLSVLTVDMPKYMFSLGLSFKPHPMWRIDAGYAYIFETATTVGLQATPSEQNASCQLAPIRPASPCVQVNAGTYRQAFNLAGLALSYRF